MRIIAGEYRGRVLKTLRGFAVRPTSGRLREALFDVLGSAVEGSVFVDCYAGSGAVGLEALSRGARQVFLIEENTAAGRLIQQNVSALGAGAKAILVRATVRAGLRWLEQRGVRADFCFLDPPYVARQEAQRLHWLGHSRFMAPGGMIIVQHLRKVAPDERVGEWLRARLLVQGSNALSFYRAGAKTSAQAQH